MLNELNWTPLQERRAQYKVIMMYRIVHGLVDIPTTHLTPQARSVRGHMYRYKIPFARTLIYQRSFFPDTIRIWNNLPAQIVEQSSLESFRQGLDNTKYILIPNVAEKNILILVEEKKKSDSEILSFNLMSNSGKKFRA
jgi:hypothetical protein